MWFILSTEGSLFQGIGTFYSGLEGLVLEGDALGVHIQVSGISTGDVPSFQGSVWFTFLIADRCKRSNKKHKTWQGDGKLKNGTTCVHHKI